MNYDEIVSAAINYSDRFDLEVSQNIDVMIILVEARVNRLLKVRQQSTRAYVPTIDNEEYYSLPPDYLGMRDIQLNSNIPTTDHSVRQYNYMSPEQLNKQRGKVYAGQLYYTIIANQLQIYPCIEAGNSIELVYYQKVPNLNAVSSINWLSNDHPDIYVAGLTAEISLFAKDYDSADGWFSRMEISIAELDNVDVKERWAGSSLITRVG